MKKISNGSIIDFEAKFSFKHLLRKPLHYVIQWASGSKTFHQGIICDGLLYEAMLKTGVRAIDLEYKCREIDKDVASVRVYEPIKKLTTYQTIKLRKDLGEQLGKEFSTLEAAFSVLTVILRQKVAKSKKMFCSKLVFFAVKNILPKKLEKHLPRTMNPEEGKKVLQKVGYIGESYILEL